MKLAFFFNIHNDESLAIRLIHQIRNHYPDAEVLAIGDGRIHPLAVISLRKAGAIVLEGERLKTPQKGWQFTTRNLENILQHTSAEVVIKTDPDTYLSRPFRVIPEGQWFGRIVRRRNHFSDGTTVIGCHGSCWGMRRELIEKLVEKNVFYELKEYYKDPNNISNKHNRRTPYEDACMALAVTQLGIIPQAWSEVYCKIGSRDIQPMAEFAAVHPNRTLEAFDLANLKKHFTPARSRQLSISTTVACPVGCKYCPNGLHVKQYGVRGDLFMSLDTFRRCLETVPKNVRIAFTGYSETFLNPQVCEMVEHASAKGHKIHAYTTLLGLTPGKLERLRDVGIFGFFIHLHDTRMNSTLVTKGYLDLLRDALQRPVAGYQVPISLGDLHPEVKALLDELGVTPIPEWSGVLNSRAGNTQGPQVPQYDPMTAIRCSENREYSNVLMPNGDVGLCCQDFGLRHIIGNLLKQDYQDLHQGEIMQQVRAMQRGEHPGSGNLLCRGCESAIGCAKDVAREPAFP